MHIHRKKRFTSFPSPAGMSLTKLPLGRNNSVVTSLFPPRESLVVTSRLGTGNSRTFYYGVRVLSLDNKLIVKLSESEWKLQQLSMWMRMRSSRVAWMRSSHVVRASDCQCRNCTGPGFESSILRQVLSEGRQMKQC
jgi:hypothetical protein